MRFDRVGIRLLISGLFRSIPHRRRRPNSSNCSRGPLIIALERRVCLDGTIPVSSIPGTYDLGYAFLALNTTSVVAGQNLTVQVNNQTTSNLAVSCSEAVSATIDGVISTSTGMAYEPSGSSVQPDQYAQEGTSQENPASASVPPGVHTVVFSISAYAATELQTESIESNGTFYSGPWVLAAGVLATQTLSGPFISQTPFTITGSPLTAVISKNTLIPKNEPGFQFVQGSKARGTFVVSVTNPSTTADTITKVNLYACPDRYLDNNATLLTTVKHSADLKPNKSTTASVPVRSIAILPAGNYSLVAAAIDASGTPAVTRIGTDLNIAPATVSLVPSSASLAVARNGTAIAAVGITSQSNVPVDGFGTIAIYAVLAPTYTNTTLIVQQREHLNFGLTNKTDYRIVRLHLTAVQESIQKSSGSSLLEVVVTDPLGGMQAAVLSI